MDKSELGGGGEGEKNTRRSHPSTLGPKKNRTTAKSSAKTEGIGRSEKREDAMIAGVMGAHGNRHGSFGHGKSLYRDLASTRLRVLVSILWGGDQQLLRGVDDFSKRLNGRSDCFRVRVS